MNNITNIYGVKVYANTCKTCGSEYTVCPYPENLEDWQNCLSPDCDSYDESRDVDKMWDEGVEFIREDVHDE